MREAGRRRRQRHRTRQLYSNWAGGRKKGSGGRKHICIVVSVYIRSQSLLNHMCCCCCCWVSTFINSRPSSSLRRRSIFTQKRQKTRPSFGRLFCRPLSYISWDDGQPETIKDTISSPSNAHMFSAACPMYYCCEFLINPKWEGWCPALPWWKHKPLFAIYVNMVCVRTGAGNCYRAGVAWHSL